MQSAKCKVCSADCRVLSAKCRVQSSGYSFMLLVIVCLASTVSRLYKLDNGRIFGREGEKGQELETGGHQG